MDDIIAEINTFYLSIEYMSLIYGNVVKNSWFLWQINVDF